MSVGTVSAAAPIVAADSAPRPSTVAGIVTMVGSGIANQVGAAIGAQAFPVLGPPGVVAIRQFVAAAVLLPVARPRLHRFTWAQWWPTLLLGLVFATMNLSLYTAVDRIGLGLAVTLEFLGPLTVALAGSRSRTDALCALGAGAGVVVLILPGPTTDYLGVALALLAAVCWASYILLNRLVGARLPGLQAPAVATVVSAVLYLPVAIGLAVQGQFTVTSVLLAVCAGVLCSVVPYAADLIVLRRIRAQFFGVFMSINPVLASLAGIAVLHQVLNLRQWIGVVAVVTANAVAISATALTRGSGPRPGSPAGAKIQTLPCGRGRNKVRYGRRVGVDRPPIRGVTRDRSPRQ